VEFTPPGADGTRVFLAQKAAVHDQRGDTLGVVTLFNDVTPFRQLDRMKSELLSMASHEIRTPLTSIQGFSELLLVKQVDQEKHDRYLGYINTQAKRLAYMISDFLDVARIEAGRDLELALEPVALEPLVRSCVEIFESRELPHSFGVDVAESLPSVEADRQKIEQVLQNLMGNAVKYSPEGGTIRVSAVPRQGAVLLEVADEGVGMTPEQVGRIFDKFYRADSSSGAVEGTGLGMFIVKYIVEAHNGGIWVESEVGHGTRVFLTLPCPEAEGPPVPERAEGEPTSGRAV
jgi:signal transduction histidine kinase